MKSSLDIEYENVLQYNLVEKEELPFNLFDIGEIIYNENIISNWYAYFFDTNQDHKLNDLFLISLIDIIYSKTDRKVEMDGCSVIREHPTGKGFIDLVLYDEGEDETFNSAIIIENKVNAALDNDLSDYYQSVDAHHDKIGIVLSLKIISFDNQDFINITHLELCQSIKNNLSSYLVRASDKHILYLKDFIETIELISKPLKMDEDIKFYIKNSKKINDLLKIRNKAETFVANSIKNQVESSEYLEWFRKNKDSISLSVTDSNYRIYVYHTEILEKGEFSVELWVQGEENISRFDQQTKSLIQSKFSDREFDWKVQGKRWMKIIYYDHNANIESGFSKIGKLIVDEIDNDYKDIIDHLKTEI